MMLSIFRVFRFAVQHIRRNLWLSLVTVTLLILPLISMNIIIALGAIGRAATSAVQDKVDVSVYFKSDVSNEDAQTVRTSLLGMGEVKTVEYIPKEAALERFKERHAGDPVILESLEELGENPFGATLAVKARQVEDYPKILKALEREDFAKLIEEKNFEDHRTTVARINQVMANVRYFGIGIATIFMVIAILIVVNSIRIAVYTHRDEVGVMRLVGAGNAFIRGPFLVKAIILSVFALLVTMMLVYPALNLIQPYVNNLFDGQGLHLIGYYNANFVRIFGGQFLAIVALSVVSTTLAIRRYLRV